MKKASLLIVTPFVLFSTLARLAWATDSFSVEKVQQLLPTFNQERFHFQMELTLLTNSNGEVLYSLLTMATCQQNSKRAWDLRKT